MQINSATLDALRTTFSEIFSGAYETTPVWYDKLATKVPSNNKGNTYGWLANQLYMREWIGPRQVQNLAEHAYLVLNKKYETTVELNRDDIDDDNLGMFSASIMPGMAQAAKKHPDRLLAAMLQSSTLGFDGVTLFNDAHPNYNSTGTGATTYDNAYTLALDPTNFNVVWSAMAGFLGENGLPLDVNPNLLIVPPQLKMQALSIMNSATYAIPGATAYQSATIDNPLRGWADVLVIPELANQPTTWYVADTTKSVKPFVYQERDAPEFVVRQDPEDPKVFNMDVFTYGTRVRDAVAPALPFLIAKSVG